MSKVTDSAEVLALLDAPTAKLVASGPVEFLFQVPSHMKDRSATEYAAAMMKRRKQYGKNEWGELVGPRFDGAALRVKMPLPAGTFIRAFGGVMQVWAPAGSSRVWLVDERGNSAVLDTTHGDFELLGSAEWSQDELFAA